MLYSLGEFSYLSNDTKTSYVTQNQTPARPMRHRDSQT